MRKIRPESRVAHIAEALRGLVGALRPGAKLPPVRTLLAQYQVSISTLDSALGVLEREGLILRRQGSGLYRQDNNRKVRVAIFFEPAFIFPQNSSPFWTLLIQQLYEEAYERGFEVSFHLSNFGAHPGFKQERVPLAIPHGLISELNDGRVDAVINVGVSTKATDYLAQFGKPMVGFASPSAHMIQQHPRAQYDLLQTAARSIGARRLLCFMREEWEDQSWRQFWFADEIETITFYEVDAFSSEHFTHHDLVAKGFRIGQALDMTRYNTNTIFSCDDTFTHGLLLGLMRQSLFPGKDVNVITHANKGSTTLLGWQGQLHLLEYDVREIAHALVETVAAVREDKRPNITLEREVSRNGDEVFLIAPHWIPPAESVAASWTGAQARA